MGSDLKSSNSAKQAQTAHIKEFIDSTYNCIIDAEDFGSTENQHWVYCDLVKHNSPALFLYSNDTQTEEDMTSNVAV